MLQINPDFKRGQKQMLISRKAIIEDRKAFKGKALRGKYVIDKEELDKLYKKIGTRDIKEVYSKSNPERLLSSYPTTVLKGDGYGEISDIIDALAYGKFQRTYNTWGHGPLEGKLWKAGSVEKEIFANLFSLRNDPKAYALVKSIIPNTVKEEFEKRLDELGKQ